MFQDFEGIIDQFNSNLWDHHLMVPLDVSSLLIERGIKRLICTLNAKDSFQCALMPKGDGRYFININKERRNKWRLAVGDRVQVRLEEDKSEYGLPMPEEFRELMLLDEEGHHFFHALTPGKQRNLLFIIGKPKKSKTRLHKAWVVLEYLKSTNGKLDFRDLNQAFKDHKEIGM